jgi:uncharacterized protein (DUF1697 family)
MTKYVAFLRAVNVGGRVVKMDELKKMFAMPGIKDISTYIQSGNVLFSATEANKQKLENKIEKTLLKELGYEVKVILKSADDMAAVVKHDPFKEMEVGADMYVTFLSAVPETALVKPLLELTGTGNEKVKLHGSNIYMQVNKGKYGETKLNNNFFEKKLKLYATTRNWNSVNKILALMQKDQ